MGVRSARMLSHSPGIRSASAGTIEKTSYSPLATASRASKTSTASAYGASVIENTFGAAMW